MRYKVTDTKEVKVSLNGATLMAVTVFKDWLRAEDKAERLRNTLSNYVSNIPDEDLPHYVAITDEMLKKQG